ncbi:hypothetical protein HWV62_9649 [Athelia sp. TMB]|nr:hypothetical protein HWV62_9649 [Athelia sp. TMB]
MVDVSPLVEDMSPVSKLPVEILSAFFREAFRWNSTNASNTISHVSRTWRVIALDDPSLWSTIYLTGRKSRKPSRFIQLCLARSKQNDLRVIYTNLSEFESHDKEVPPFDPAFLYLPRCRQLELLFEERLNAHPIVEGLRQARAPKLVSFKLVILGGTTKDRPETYRPGNMFTGGAPMLTIMALEGVGVLQCHASLSNITALSLKGCRPYERPCPDPFASEFVEFLREAAPTLRRLALDGNQVFRNHRADKPWSVVELPALTKLCFGNVDENDYIRDFWQFVKMPRLEDLSLYSIPVPLLAGVWAALEGQGGARVARLSLDNHSQPLEQLVAIFPNIQNLAIDWGNIHNVLANAVAADRACVASGERPAWPLLESLSISLNEPCGDNVEERLVRRFIRGRTAVGHPLKAVTLVGSKWPGPKYRLLRCAREHVRYVTFDASLERLAREEYETQSEEDD